MWRDCEDDFSNHGGGVGVGDECLLVAPVPPHHPELPGEEGWRLVKEEEEGGMRYLEVRLGMCVSPNAEIYLIV